MIRKPVFWVVFFILSIICSAITYLYFSSAFPIVNVDLRMDREGALGLADNLAEKYHWGPDDHRLAASFGVDSQVQNYVELEAGGIEAFSELIKGDLYSPYTWRVRLFKEGDANEVRVWLTPDGNPYGFFEKLPEDDPGANLPREEARQIVVAASSEWSIRLEDYDLVEESEEIQTGGRTDHTFVYERKAQNLGEAKYRLRLTVAGDKFVGLRHFIKIPEAFDRRYEEMRSANDTIAVGASFAMGILYILGGCIIGLFFLLRQHWVQWKQPLTWGLFIGFLQVLVGLNSIPISWMGYDTALSSGNFLFQQFAGALANGVLMGILMTLSFMAAESLSRKAFPHHIQLWKLWSKDIAPSTPVLGQTVAGYLMIGIFFAYEVGLYFTSTEILGWWSPSSALFNPDTLATYFPWLTSIAISAQAGFWEESLFRAVPIAGAALLGQRYGNKKLWIIGALVIQALIFGGGHANYPAQPAYARVVELVIPSIAWGLIYISYGLLPAVVLHFAYDVVWFALPLFVSSAPGVWIDQVLVIILALVPLWVILIRRVKTGRWRRLTESAFNRSWKPILPEPKIKIEESEQAESIHPVKTIPLIPIVIGGLLGLVLWIVATPFVNDALPLNVQRQSAEETAISELKRQGFEVESPWHILSTVEVPLNENDRFIWQKGGSEVYKKLMGTYLGAPYWIVRVARFEGDVAERAEEFEVWVNGSGEILRKIHRLPEAREGAILEEDQARIIVDQVIREKFKIDPSELEIVSSEPSKLENRQDWLFTFKDTKNYPLDEGEARLAVRLAGDEVADSYQYIYVPEEWGREERSKRTLLEIFSIGCSAILGLAIFAGSIAAIVSWSRKKFAVKAFVYSLGTLFVLSLVNLLNNWPNISSQFSTAQPYKNQVFIFIVGGLVGALFVAAAIALVIGLVHYWNREKNSQSYPNRIPVGLALGSLIAGISALVGSIGFGSDPTWPSYNSASALFPILASSLGPLTSLIINVSVLLLVIGTVTKLTKSWTSNKSLGSALLVTVGIIISGTGGIDSIFFWILSGLITGLVLLVVYIFLIRFEWGLVPMAIGLILVLSQVNSMLVNAFPDSMIGGIIASFLLILVAVFWSSRISLER